jgi:ElaB/YqjD/DUF883 family membrane-anchored ribosome-binding protein
MKLDEVSTPEQKMQDRLRLGIQNELKKILSQLDKIEQNISKLAKKSGGIGDRRGRAVSLLKASTNDLEDLEDTLKKAIMEI